jgi:hydrogenase nickel incorporation protein HypA/HybF
VHELALADSVVRAALQAADQAGMERLERVHVKIGELQAIERDLFEFSLTNVIPAQDPRLEGVVFEVVEEKVRFLCRSCGHEYGREDVDIDTDGDEGEAVHFIPELSHAYARCPECRSPDFDITAGRGITLSRIEGFGGSDDEP